MSDYKPIHVKGGKFTQNFNQRNLKERDILEGLDMVGGIMSK
jgi:hypothetical protein